MVEYIGNKLPLEERLAGLAEECCELAQAALKLRRVLDQTNPTPMSVDDAWDKVAEEIADVRVCLKVIDLPIANIQQLSKFKLERWYKRLHEKEENK